MSRRSGYSRRPRTPRHTDMEKQLTKICAAFGLEGVTDCSVIPSGHINRTLRINVNNVPYLVQEINTKIFRDPHSLTRAAAAVSEKMTFAERPRYLTTSDGEFCLRGDDGIFRRIYNYIHSDSFTCTDSPLYIEAAANAFSRFLCDMESFDRSLLYSGLSGFHDTERYTELLLLHAEKALPTEEKVLSCLNFVVQNKESLSLLKSKRLPSRIIHGDAKLSNVLFEKGTARALTVIDLDTVMCGEAALDFGDLARSCAYDIIDDAPRFSAEKFAAAAKGYISAAEGILTDEEVLSLPLGFFTITAELGIRRLDDYITNAGYFHTEAPTENLYAAEKWFCLAEDILKNLDTATEIIRQTKSSC